MRVLVIDDDPTVRALIAMSLTTNDMVIHTAVNGKDALDVIRDSAQSFDVIVLDLSMPVMDGRHFYRQLQEMPAPPPVLLLSAEGAMRAQAELGAEAAMAKPFDPDLLLQSVVAVAEGRRGSTNADRNRSGRSARM